MKTINFIITVSIVVVSFQFLSAQDTIYLKNPSFEDIPRKGGSFPESINGWYDCGLLEFPGETAPDIHPVIPDAAWDVELNAMDGRTYLGLVVRDNNTYEAVSQKLHPHLKKDRCYYFSVYLVQSEFYKSITKLSNGQLENFSEPAELHIWGGNKVWPKKEILARSAPIKNKDWLLYEFTLSPSRSYSFITIAAYYVDPRNRAYNGHILIDGLSPIIEIDCK